MGLRAFFRYIAGKTGPDGCCETFQSALQFKMVSGCGYLQASDASRESEVQGRGCVCVDGADVLDYYLIAGKNTEEIIGNYRKLFGEL